MTENQTTAQGFEAFIAQTRSELEKDTPDATVQLDADQIQAAVFAMQKTALLFTGSPVGTVLRNKVTGVVAERFIHPETGIPQWSIRDNGATSYNHSPVLLPESDWQCIYDPDAEDDSE